MPERNTYRRSEAWGDRVHFKACFVARKLYRDSDDNLDWDFDSSRRRRPRKRKSDGESQHEEQCQQAEQQLAQERAACRKRIRWDSQELGGDRHNKDGSETGSSSSSVYDSPSVVQRSIARSAARKGRLDAFKSYGSEQERAQRLVRADSEMIITTQPPPVLGSATMLKNQKARRESSLSSISSIVEDDNHDFAATDNVNVVEQPFAQPANDKAPIAVSSQTAPICSEKLLPVESAVRTTFLLPLVTPKTTTAASNGGCPTKYAPHRLMFPGASGHRSHHTSRMRAVAWHNEPWIDDRDGTALDDLSAPLGEMDCCSRTGPEEDCEPTTLAGRVDSTKLFCHFPSIHDVFYGLHDEQEHLEASRDELLAFTTKTLSPNQSSHFVDINRVRSRRSDMLYESGTYAHVESHWKTILVQNWLVPALLLVFCAPLLYHGFWFLESYQDNSSSLLDHVDYESLGIVMYTVREDAGSLMTG
jgi:hypothetical protein